MNSTEKSSLALIVSSDPFQRRSARGVLDLALAAAAMEQRVEIYFQGRAVLQLAAERDVSAAGLPAGSRAWGGLPELGEARVFAEQAWLEFGERHGLEWMLPVKGLKREMMKTAWRHCRHVMVV